MKIKNDSKRKIEFLVYKPLEAGLPYRYVFNSLRYAHFSQLVYHSIEDIYKDYPLVTYEINLKFGGVYQICVENHNDKMLPF